MNKKSQAQVKKHMSLNGLTPFVPDGGCKPVKVSDAKLRKALVDLSLKHSMHLW